MNFVVERKWFSIFSVDNEKESERERERETDRQRQREKQIIVNF